MSASTRKLGISFEKCKDTIHRVLQEKGMKFQKVQKKSCLMMIERLREYNFVKRCLKEKENPLKSYSFLMRCESDYRRLIKAVFGWDLGRRSKLKTLLKISNLIVGEQYPKMAKQPFIYSKII